jgi:CRISPR-associated protein Csh1
MVNKTAELTEKLKEVARNEHLHIGSDDEFAFGAGQLIWKILSQSKSASRSHALLEPFLQKVEPALFKQAIAKAFDTYKHEFVFYPKKYEFDKIMGEVMGFEPNEKNMKNQLPLILAGYFAETIFKADSNN